ncbi:DUF7010 family protein [Spirosoma spitsbergense]|uniref:DUF7010 family protein n=1 Tax=Spirosoma spitsbergense TaxID=431554 RepID=UPI00035F57A0|nr:hypothetical protein [Spirosoma spitsbergense]
MPSFTKSDLDLLRLDLTVKAKNGLNFIVAAILIWLLITYIWTLPYSTGSRGLLTFYAGGLMLPLAWVFSKLMRTSWNMPDNPIQPLGLWLNFAQLVYFPILVFVYLRHTEHFIMVYVIITGAHFLPYAWFYNTKSFAVMSVLISVGAMWLGLILPVQNVYLIPLFLSASLCVLAIWIGLDYQAKKKLVKAYL